MQIIDIRIDKIYGEYFEDMGYTYAKDGFVEFLVAEVLSKDGYRLEYKGRPIYRLMHCHTASKVHVYYQGGGDELIENDFELEVTRTVRKVITKLV